jgi:hypothetical protein
MAKKLTVALCLAFLSQGNIGCFVFEELQKANESVGVVDPSKAREAEEAKRKIADAKQAKKDAVKDYWQEVQSLAPAELDESIVRCNNNGSVSFMSSDDCLSIGGTVQ